MLLQISDLLQKIIHFSSVTFYRKRGFDFVTLVIDLLVDLGGLPSPSRCYKGRAVVCTYITHKSMPEIHARGANYSSPVSRI